MADEKGINFSKLSPYDSSGEVNLSMYDKLPYKRNYDACNAEHIAKESGNILKYYRYVKKDSYKVDNQDSTFHKRIASMKKIEPGQMVDLGDFSADFPDKGLTDEQMNELFKDEEPNS